MLDVTYISTGFKILYEKENHMLIEELWRNTFVM